MRYISLLKQSISNQQSGLSSILSIIAACACIYSVPVAAFDGNEIGSLRNSSIELAAIRKDLTKIRNKRDAIEDKLQREEGTLQLLQSKENHRKQEYRKLLKIVSDNPDLDLDNKVSEKKDLYNSQKKLVDDQKAKIREIEGYLAKYNNRYREKKSEIVPLEKGYTSLKKAIIDKELKKRIRSYKISKKVTATGTYSCGDLKVSECKARARKNAEQVAVEQGSSVLINSMTEVKNFQLSKEIIRSEIGATLSDIKVKKKGWKGDDTWSVTITALVTPRLSKRFKTEMSANIEDDLNSKLALNSPIGTMDSAYTPPPTPGLVKEDYPQGQKDANPGARHEKAREKERQARTVSAQKSAEAAAAAAAAREAEAEAEATARELEAVKNTQGSIDDAQPAKKRRRIIGGF